jgi:hypothetical protein
MDLIHKFTKKAKRSTETTDEAELAAALPSVTSNDRLCYNITNYQSFPIKEVATTQWQQFTRIRIDYSEADVVNSNTACPLFLLPLDTLRLILRLIKRSFDQPFEIPTDTLPESKFPSTTTASSTTAPQHALNAIGATLRCNPAIATRSERLSLISLNVTCKRMHRIMFGGGDGTIATSSKTSANITSNTTASSSTNANNTTEISNFIGLYSVYDFRAKALSLFGEYHVEHDYDSCPYATRMYIRFNPPYRMVCCNFGLFVFFISLSLYLFFFLL